MKYADGKQAALGDRVRLWGSAFGTIVCSIDDGSYSDEFKRENWAYKERGVVIRRDDGDIYHYDEADEDLEFIARADRVV